MIAEGYKDTEIGVIPIEWEVETFENISELNRGTSFTKKNLIEGNIPVIAGGKEPAYYHNDYNREGETITISGSGANAGYVNFFTTKIFVSDGFTVKGKTNKSLTKYLYYYLKSKQEYIYYQQSGGAQPHIYTKNIAPIQIPLPPLKEQEKIADILSTADDKIDAITSQIKKTEILKKGLLQKLLSEGVGHSEFKDSELGKIPLSWEVEKLDDLSKITMGQSPKSDTYNTDNIGMPLIQGNADCKNRKTIPRTYTTELTKECFVGDIIMTVRAPVGAISKSLHNACIGRGVCSIKPKEDNEYIYHCLVAYEDKWDKLSQGSTFTAVSGSDIKNLKFPLPPLEEQKQIADILSTADEKLEVLRAKKQMYETLKKGLLQKLLSGEVRV